MKTLLFTFFFLATIPFAGATETCEIDYLKFCSNQDPRILNMCPEILGHHLKKTCVVTRTQAQSIRLKCARELTDVCRVADGDDFLNQYVCLTNPEKWEKFKPECLKSLVKGNPHH